MRQTTVQQFNTIRFGSGKFEVNDGFSWIDLGAMRDIEFEEEWDKVTVMSDNAGEIVMGIRNHKAALGGSLMEINLANLNTLRGGIDNYSVNAGVIVSDAEQFVDSGDWADSRFIKIANQNHDQSAITVNFVAGRIATEPAEAGTDDTTVNITGHGLQTGDYMRNLSRNNEVRVVTRVDDDQFTVAAVTNQAEGDNIELYLTYNPATPDYEQVQDANGDRGLLVYIAGIPALAHDIMINYDYTPPASRILMSGGRQTINAMQVRVTNYNEAGQMFRVTVRKATTEEGIVIDFQADDDEDPNMVPIKMVGTLDTTQAVGEQLFVIYDEQGV